MALDASRLGIAIEAALADYNDVDITDINTARTDIAHRLAAAIINEFKNFGEVQQSTPTGLVAPGGAGGPVTGSTAAWKLK